MGRLTSAGGIFERLEDRELLAADVSAAAAVQSEYGRLPLSFEVNQGQTASQVNYLSCGAGYTLYLTGSGAVLDLQQPATQPTSGKPTGQVSGTVIDMQFVGANPGATVTGLDKQQTVSNYFVGSDPSQWRTDIANYGQVEYQNLYSGISATFHGNQGQLEYDFNIAPGADLNQIKWQIAGASGLSIDSAGNLLIHTDGVDLVEKAPDIYQEINGGRVPVSGHFVLEAADRVGFAVGNHDLTAPLVIDPTLSYSTYLAGAGPDNGGGIAIDGAGDAYVTGYASSTNFPTTPGAFQVASASTEDAFVAKLNAAGSGLVYSTYLGGSGNDSGRRIAVDIAGNAYVTGQTDSSDFPVTPGAFQMTLAGSQNAFVTKLNAAGGGLVYSTYLGGSAGDIGLGIAVNVAGDAYVTGQTGSTDFPTTPGAFQTTLAGSHNAFITKLNAAGSALVYSTYLGGSGNALGSGIAVDIAGNACVTGQTDSSDFPVTAGALQTTFGGGAGDAFAAKLNAAGSALVYATYLGGSGDDVGNGIAIDGAGDAYVTGYASSTNFPVSPGAIQTTQAGGYDAFITKLNAAGSALVYSTYLGGSDTDVGSGIEVDGAGDAYVTGYASSTNFPVTLGAFQTTYGGGSGDAFLAKLNALGNKLIYSTYLGGSEFDSGNAIGLDSAGNAYLIGGTQSSNFPVSAGAYKTNLAGTQNAFITKLLTAATHDQQFIDQLYHGLLNKEADFGGLSYWDAQLAAGVTRAQVALDIQQSLEYLQDVVQSLYTRYLHRTADADGLSYFVQALNQGATVEQVAAALAGSEEFFVVQGGGTNNGFLNALYQDALGRPIDPGGLASWSAQLAAGVSRTQVAFQVHSSQEYRQDVVVAAYQQFLGRLADHGGLAFWVNALNAGATDQQLIADLAGTDEYYARTA